MKKPFAITLEPGTSLANLTGSWRTNRPVYLDRLPPCNATCPAGENIQGWLYAAEEGDYESAWREIVKNNPFPAIMGRVCYHTCESACNRGKFDASVGIHAVERFLGDKAIKEGWQVEVETEASGKTVAVVGAGPSGLSCAYHLRRLGHRVTVFEAAPKAGGMMRYGIPRYRLPRGTLDAEIARIEAMGVEIRVNTKVESLEALRSQFDAIYLASGAHAPRRTPIAGSAKLLDAVDILRDFELNEQRSLGKRVVVYGGGNTAIDVARSAIRLGAKQVTVVVRNTRENMAAHDFEVKEALEEGVSLKTLSTIKQADTGEVILEAMKLVDGKLVPTGRFETLPCDTVVLAIGQEAEFQYLGSGVATDNGRLPVDAARRTSLPGVFAGGDMTPGERTVTVAIGHGKQAARHIDAFLKDTRYVPAPKHEVASFDKLNAWYYTEAPKTIEPMLDLVRRQSGFEEVVGNLDETNALFEARRCFSCGNCFECDNCYGVCPDNAVIKLGTGKRFKFNYDYCKGCGLCVSECPCGSIAMVPESK